MENKSTVFFGEVLMRLTTKKGIKLETSNEFDMTIGGSELNTSILMKRLGDNVKMVTILPDSPLGHNTLHFIASNNIGIDNIALKGNRMGLYFNEQGAGSRGGKIIYDRKESAFSQIKGDEFDWDKILDDCSLFHFTGITPALSIGAKDELSKVISLCAKKGIMMSCDVNYRSSLWGKEEASETLSSYLSLTDICIINEEHARLLFDITSEKRDEKGELTKDGYTEIAEKLEHKFGCEYIVLTIRYTVSNEYNKLGCMVYSKGKSYFSDIYDVPSIVDKIGGGDAFTGAFLHCIRNGYDLDFAVNYSVCANVLKHSIYGDVPIISNDEILKVLSGKAGRLNR